MKTTAFGIYLVLLKAISFLFCLFYFGNCYTCIICGHIKKKNLSQSGHQELLSVINVKICCTFLSSYLYYLIILSILGEILIAKNLYCCKETTLKTETSYTEMFILLKQCLYKVNKFLSPHYFKQFYLHCKISQTNQL